MQMKNFVLSLILLEMLSLPPCCFANSGTAKTTLTLVVPEQEERGFERGRRRAAQHGVLISAMIQASLRCLQSIHEADQCRDYESWNSI